MIEKSTQEDITIVNTDEHSTEAPQCGKQMLTDMKGEADGSTAIVGDFRTPLASTDGSFRHEANKETHALSGALDQMDFTGI